MHIKNTNDITPVQSPSGETIREYMGNAAGGATQHSLAQITLPPGGSAPRHYHPANEESYLILSGTGRVTLDDETRSVSTGDAIAIPINVVHTIINDSQEDLVFLAICVPPWTPDCSVFL
jgi:mannose-6-phosphate isomerase-like protein (cupin superfamily)